MGSNGEFGPDTETIRAWLEKRATYAKDARVIGPRGGATVTSPPATSSPVDTMTPTAAPPVAPDPASPVAPTSGGVPDGVDASRAVLAALGIGADAPETDRPTEPTEPDPHAVGRSVVDAVREEAPRPEARARATRPARGRSDATVVPEAGPGAGAGRVVQVGRWTEPEENLTAHQASTDVDFPVRGSGVRRSLALFLLASVTATAGAAYLAIEDPTPSTLGIAGVLGLLTLVIWAVRAGSVTTEVSLRRGQLIVRRGASTERADLLNQRAPVAIIGEPGHRRWTVLVERPGRPLVVIDATMVDPHWFTSALYRLRPELRPGHVPDVVGGDDADAGEDAWSDLS